jgi:hypothetical protein
VADGMDFDRQGNLHVAYRRRKRSRSVASSIGSCACRSETQAVASKEPPEHQHI